MANLFDNPNVEFVVLVNGDGQHSLWPDTIGLPPGWDAVFGPGRHGDCLD